MFQYVFIPSDNNQVIEQRSASKEGGLENDALRRGAEDFFQEKEEAIDYEAERRATGDALVQQGMESSKIRDIMDTIGGRRIGSNVEIITVSVANEMNHFIAVSMYSDGHIAFKLNPPTNSRATKLLRSCGQDIDVKGDVFVGRSFDDEREEWTRLDFNINDLDSNSPWISSTKSANVGRNMGAYRTSGAMKKMIQPGTAAADEELGAQSAEPIDKGYMSWSQSIDEVEVRFALLITCTAKSLIVTITSSSLRICGKSGEHIGDVGQQFQTPGGAPLFGKIIKDDSTWSISTENDMKVLTITLAKADSINWHQFLSI